ncbi:hypothetical protein EGW08_004624 [Elysia chlorotica]|uniref:Integrase catalytic domain-containing protein n=1 Tax=Elysia chlorotica TaxID=188477 RepID=A0A433U1D1_ELYCH|nr:hypothetical protein EGW08_004624 [Elysia chlorotica]
MEVYLEASGATAKPEKARTAIILHCAGPDALEVYDQFEFTEDEDKDNPETVLEKLRQYCNPRSNEVLMRYRFWNIAFSEPFDKFVTELRTQAEQCSFEEKEKMIRDKIVFTVPKVMKEKLLRDTALTLKRAIEICQAYEQTTSHVQEMQHEASSLSSKIEKVNFQKSTKAKTTLKTYEKKQKPRGGECKFCGYQHEFDKTKCPAWGKKCSLCQGRNHFKKQCRKVHAVAYDGSSESENDEAWLNAVGSGKERTTAQLRVNGCQVRFQLDTAADVNTIQRKFIKKEQASKTTKKLVMWNGTKMQPQGEACLTVENPKTGTKHKVKFIVVKNKYSCLLENSTSQELNFIQIKKANYIFAVDEQGEGLGTAHLTVDPSVKPKILPCLNIPLALKPKVDEEIKTLIGRGILKVVDEPTDWVSSEIFQKHLSVALQGLDSIVNCADDIIIVGRGATKEAALVDHDRNYKNLKVRCREKQINLNEEKAKVRQDEVSFMGHKISHRGIEPDEKKVEAILKMPAPTDVHGVRRFCGMVQYLSRFLDKLSDMMKPLRELTKKDHEFKWTEECQNSFNKVKKTIANTPVLKYFSTEKPLEVQVDSSKDGLGAVLLQNGQPIEFASRTLTESEKRWAQIEKEMLAIVYGLERFDQYTFGREVSVTTDHKPLEIIIKKPLSEAPRRLQRLLMKANRYNFNLNWARGTSLLIADTLSRASICNIQEDQKDDQEPKCHLPDPILQRIRTETDKDESLQCLKQTIQSGWPRSKNNLPADLTPYYDLQETLSIEDGLITKGERVLIPKSLRKEIKDKLHAAHMASESMLRRARKTVFWPGMTAEIKQMADNCTACQETKPRNQKESLKQHAKGASPWEKVATDLFHIKGRDYLVLVDYFSNFIEVDYLPSTTSKAVISKLKSHFARYGIPKILISDCGPQYTSSEFAEFAKDWGFANKTSSPAHRQANGKAESAVKIMKIIMLRCSRQSEDQHKALLGLRSTPRQDDLTPAELVFKQRP